MSTDGLQCQPVCEEEKVYMLHHCTSHCPQNTEQFVCVVDGCGTNIPAKAMDIIRSETCSYQQVMGTTLTFLAELH